MNEDEEIGIKNHDVDVNHALTARLALRESEKVATSGGCSVFFLVLLLVLLPWPVKWATLVMIGVSLATRFILPGKASEASFFVLLGYAFFGNFGYQCWWLVLPFIIICYFADCLRKNKLLKNIAVIETMKSTANQTEENE